MMPRPVLFLALAVGIVTLVARAEGTQDKASAAPTPEAVRNEVVRSQDALARKFRDFRASLLRRAQRLERGPGPKDRARAATLKKALDSSSDAALDARFDNVITALKTPKAIGLADVNTALEHVRPLPEKLWAMLTTLAADPRELPVLLNARCQYLLRMQVEIYDGTVQLAKAIAANPDKKPSRADTQKALGLSDRAGEIDREAGQLVRLLEDRAPKSPYLEALRTLGDEARRVQHRLAKVDVGVETRALEARIGAKLKEAVAAIRKEAPDDLLAERRSREGKELGRRLELAALMLGEEVTRLHDARSHVLAVIKAVELKEFHVANFSAQARRVGEAEKAVGRALEGAREVQADCAALHKELKAKKALPGLTARLEGRVGKPLGQAVNEEFPAARKALGAFRAALEAGKLDANKSKGAGERMAQLLGRLDEAKDGLQDLPDIGELIAILSEIEWEQREILKRIHDLAGRLVEDLLK